MNLAALQTKVSADFNTNLEHISRIIEETPKNSLILAPELCLTGYAYDDLNEASIFSKKALEKLLSLSKNRTIALTLTTKKNNQYFNTFHFLHQEKIIHTQSKAKLFTLNQEEVYFTQGREEDIQLFEYNGLKIGVVICFELRFIDFWQKLKGADIILIPAYWGIKRKDNLEVLSRALAVANQCFVVVSNCANDECAKSSAIISPFGEALSADNEEVLLKNINLKEIEEMRRYLPIGLTI